MSISRSKVTKDEHGDVDQMPDASGLVGVLQLLYAHGGGNRPLCLHPASVLLHGGNLAGRGTHPQIPLRHGCRARDTDMADQRG